MPTAPLYYTPLVHAAIQSTPLGATPDGKPGPTVAALVDKQVNFDLRDAQGNRALGSATATAAEMLKSPLKDGITTTMSGLIGLVDSRKGAEIARVNLALDPDGYVANRVLTVFGNDPAMLDTASPDEASRMTQTLAGQLAREAPTAKAAGGVLDVGPGVSALLLKSWQKQPLTPDETVMVGFHVGREVEKAVTPSKPESTSPLSWLEDGAADALALWPGAVASNTRKLGITSDWAKVDELATSVRKQALTEGPNRDANQSVHGLLELAGVEMNNAAAAPKVSALLQDVSLDKVPFTLAAGIAQNYRLAEDKIEWLAGRIVDVGGRPGNVGGLRAELEQLKPPPPPPPANPPAPPAAAAPEPDPAGAPAAAAAPSQAAPESPGNPPPPA